MRDALRLAWRLHRWELIFVAVACIGLAAGAGVLAYEMRAMLATCDPGPADAMSCTSPYRFQDSHSGRVSLLTTMGTALPFVMGLVLGVPLVAREVEHRTAHLAWSLSGSRLRWLLLRVAPLAIVALLLASLPAIAVDQMLRARWPQSDLGLLEYGAHGVPLVTRTALALALGLGVGALVGRVLPALLVGIFLCVAVSVSLNLMVPLWLPAEELAPMGEDDVDARLGARSVSSAYRMPDGTMLSHEEGQAIIEAAYEAAWADGESEPDPATLPQDVAYGIPAHRYPDVVVREAVGMGAATLVLAGLAAAAVHRRRPG